MGISSNFWTALILAFGFISLSKQEENLKISVYYETYCPDSINFMMNQLSPLMGAFNRYPDWLVLDLLPYGFAKEKGHHQYTCQHGPKECEGNKLNACAIDCLVTEMNPPHYMRLVNFIYCTMNSADQLKAAHKCALQTGVDYHRVMRCYKGQKGDKLMQTYAKRTAALQPSLSWVPSVVFNDKYNDTENQEAQTDLYGVVCKYVPDQCE